MEWADVLNEWKCGGEKPDWRDEIEPPKVGEIYRVHDYLMDTTEYMTVTEQNINWIRWALTSRDNDMYSVTKSVRR